MIIKRGLSYLTRLLASFFYLGYIPLAPGTMGTLGGVGVYLFLFFFAPGFIPDALGKLTISYAGFLAGFFLIGVYFSTRGEKVWKRKDAPFIVIDEAFSFFITMFCLPLSLITVLGGFVLNRFFDVVKLFPARRLESIPGGWGVMLDDVVAGIYSNLVLRVIICLITLLNK